MQPAGPAPRISILIPVFDEASHVAQSVARLRALPFELEVVCVDDGSTDGTWEALRELRRAGVVDVLLRHERNRGKGAAVRTALARATGDVVVIQDADLEYDPIDLPAVLAPILAGRADAVVGTRFVAAGGARRWSAHRLVNRGLTRLSNALTGLELTDMENGYKAARADLIRSLPLRSDRFGIEPELAARLAQAGARVAEVPVRYTGRTWSEGKKIGWRDGVAAVFHILRASLLPPRPPLYRPRPAPRGALSEAAPPS